MNKKHIIVGIILVLMAIALGSSLAWWTWSTNNEQITKVNLDVEGVTISYEDGENITNNNLIPTSTKEKGISKNITISTNTQIYLDLYLNIVTLPNELKELSFKYALYEDDLFITDGSFKYHNQDDTIALFKGKEVTDEETYTLYIWIDGNMSNPNTMYNQNFEFNINATATTEPSASYQTLVKLGLENGGMRDPYIQHNPTTKTELYEAQDDYGTSYYFDGHSVNNYVYSADYYWRIVRINGNGSIRLIYDGTVAHANEEVSEDRIVGTTPYNELNNDATYVGYMYGSTRATSYEESHQNLYNSKAKEYVDNWYKTNIVDKGYSDKVEEDAIYCNDRSVDLRKYQSNNGGGYGRNAGDFMSFQRAINRISNVTLKCPNINLDGFSTGNATKGNKKLTYPIALITLDELKYVGMYSADKGFYFAGFDYWTMSPAVFFGTYGQISGVSANRSVYAGLNINNSQVGIKPVISLKADTQLSGSGTMTDPYVVQ